MTSTETLHRLNQILATMGSTLNMEDVKSSVDSALEVLLTSLRELNREVCHLPVINEILLTSSVARSGPIQKPPTRSIEPTTPFVISLRSMGSLSLVMRMVSIRPSKQEVETVVA